MSDIINARDDKTYYLNNIIHVSEQYQSMRYSILDIKGRTMFSGILQNGESTISVENLSNGTYLLVLPNVNNLKPFIFNK